MVLDFNLNKNLILPIFVNLIIMIPTYTGTSISSNYLSLVYQCRSSALSAFSIKGCKTFMTTIVTGLTSYSPIIKKLSFTRTSPIYSRSIMSILIDRTRTTLINSSTDTSKTTNVTKFTSYISISIIVIIGTRTRIVNGNVICSKCG